MGQNIVNLREAEYQAVMAELETMHENQLETIRAVIEQIKEMVTSKDTFSTVETSKNILLLLGAINSNVVGLLEQAFQDSEAGVANMIETTMITDSISC